MKKTIIFIGIFAVATLTLSAQDDNSNKNQNSGEIKTLFDRVDQ